MQPFPRGLLRSPRYLLFSFLIMGEAQQMWVRKWVSQSSFTAPNTPPFRKKAFLLNVFSDEVKPDKEDRMLSVWILGELYGSINWQHLMSTSQTRNPLRALARHQIEMSY